MKPADHRPASRASLIMVLALALGLPTAGGGCGDSGAESAREAAGTIPAETFVGTFVELRMAGLEGESGVPSAEARDSILARYDVTVEELVRFAEVHGRDPQLMSQVWDSVEVRIQERLDAMEDSGA